MKRIVYINILVLSFGCKKETITPADHPIKNPSFDEAIHFLKPN